MSARVVILTTYFRPIVGGVESNAERFAGYLHAASVPVQVITKQVARELPRVERLDGVSVRRIGPPGERSPYGKWRLIPSAVSWLVRNRSAYDVVCCIDFRGIGVAPIVARRITGRPVLFQAQTPGAFSGEYAPAGILGRGVIAPVRAIYRRADAFACIGRALEREAIDAGIPRERVHFLPNPVDMTRFRPAEEGERRAIRLAQQIPDDSVACVFVGRLSREKGVMDLLEAWRMVARQELRATPAPHATQQQGMAARRAMLLVAGPDMDGHAWNVGPQARAFVQEHDLSTSVRFLGGSADIPTLLRAADVLVQPSHFEAQGLSAIEALASGVPVVASAVGGLLDFIADGVNGRFVPAQDPRALGAALRQVIEDTALRQAMTARARASVADDYDEQRVFARFAVLLDALAEARPR